MRKPRSGGPPRTHTRNPQTASSGFRGNFLEGSPSCSLEIVAPSTSSRHKTRRIHLLTVTGSISCVRPQMTLALSSWNLEQVGTLDRNPGGACDEVRRGLEESLLPTSEGFVGCSFVAQPAA